MCEWCDTRLSQIYLVIQQSQDPDKIRADKGRKKKKTLNIKKIQWSNVMSFSGG